MKIANTYSQLLEFIDETKKISQFKLEKIDIDSQNQWLIRNGVLSHESNSFFHVTGVINKQGYEQLMLYQPQSALTGLALHKENEKVYVLVQARVEPGNTGVVQYGPTVQSTAGNYMRFHGGKKTSYLELFFSYTPGCSPLCHSYQFDLGDRYFQKNKSHHYVELENFIETEENMIWASLDSLIDLLHHSDILNPDLRSLLIVFDWDDYLQKSSTTEALVTNNSQLCNYLFNKPNHLEPHKLIPLTELKNWEITNQGIIDKTGRGVSVNMYSVECTNREVKTWSQPLYCVANQGNVQQIIRKKGTNYEFLVTINKEVGLSSQPGVSPTYIRYPGSPKPFNSLVSYGDVLYQMNQCEEGGRFYQNDILYQVILVEEDYHENNNQCWISSVELKNILKSSSKASLPLRCICSMLFNILNPLY